MAGEGAEMEKKVNGAELRERERDRESAVSLNGLRAGRSGGQ